MEGTYTAIWHRLEIVNVAANKDLTFGVVGARLQHVNAAKMRQSGHVIQHK